MSGSDSFNAINLVFAHGREELMRADSDDWVRTNLPRFAALAQQLREEACKKVDDGRPHLRLAAWFDGLAADANCETLEYNPDDVA